MHPEFAEYATGEANAVDKVALNKTDLRILEILKGGEQSRSQLAEALQMSSRSGTLKRSIDKLLELKRIEFTVPDTPRSPNQKLRLPASKDVP